MSLFDVRYLEIFALVLFFISFFGLITAGNMIKTVIFVLLIQTSVIMFWLTLGVETAATPVPPIIYDAELLENAALIADPLPQALTLTAIIIGFTVTAIIIVMLNNLFRRYGTASWREIEALEKC